eukprot:CAMPEP_0172325746 /NCGR_PEP_ID=MMETSP1058-20130122/54673_1 /TAXON_ID=83371 /ORGANISM="Detonula confervacea, Strain CCMP 353" /LENGTH=236 /DNA_ID=CAMNT_0013042355 /DNA_START=104 /DNA_END=814 /DNA_ORIENTATION=-
MRTWTTFLNVLCTLLPIFTFASPATVFLPVLLIKSSTSNKQQNAMIEMPPLALTTQMLQCFLFAIYAHHLHMWTLFIPNLAGFLLGFVWSTIYPFKVASDGGLRLQWRIQYTISILLMMLGALTIRTLPYLSSTIAAAVGVLMCTYPLPSMRQAYKEKNSNLMGSSVMNVAMFATCLAWVVHSSWLVEYDIFVLVSNTSGVVVQGGAMILRAIIARRTQVIAQAENAELSASTSLL